MPDSTRRRPILRPPARLTLFGHEAVPASVEVLRRGRAWRLLGALGIFGLAALVAPVSLLVPPHALWLMGVLGAGAILARHRWLERYTLLALEGRCPRCGAELRRRRPTRLRRPHTVPCETCHHEASLVVDVEG